MEASWSVKAGGHYIFAIYVKTRRLFCLPCWDPFSGGLTVGKHIHAKFPLDLTAGKAESLAGHLKSKRPVGLIHVFCLICLNISVAAPDTSHGGPRAPVPPRHRRCWVSKPGPCWSPASQALQICPSDVPGRIFVRMETAVALVNPFGWPYPVNWCSYGSFRNRFISRFHHITILVWILNGILGLDVKAIF